MLAKRVIPCLNVHAGAVTRGQQFGRAEEGGLRNVGDPVELALRYNQQGAQLVFYDITATAQTGPRWCRSSNAPPTSASCP